MTHIITGLYQNLQNPIDSPSTLPKDKNKKKAIINRAKDKLKIWRHKSRESSTKNNLSSQGKIYSLYHLTSNIE